MKCPENGEHFDGFCPHCIEAAHELHKLLAAWEKKHGYVRGAYRGAVFGTAIHEMRLDGYELPRLLLLVKRLYVFSANGLPVMPRDDDGPTTN